VFGVVLLALALAVTGAGHGVYFPLGIVAAPVSLLGIIPALVGVIPLWAVVGALSGGNQTARRRLGIWLIVQNVAAIIVVLVGPFADLGYLRGPRQTFVPWIVGIVVLYSAGQGVLWMRIRGKPGLKPL